MDRGFCNLPKVTEISLFFSWPLTPTETSFMLFSKSFTVFALTFMSLIHLKSGFLYGVWHNNHGSSISIWLSGCSGTIY